jgi:prepilin signal peptidase PulO-like enzyme (type II secretory pathway)
MGINALIYVIAAVVSAFFGVLAGFGVVYVYNRMPARWLCDYDEEPDERHLPPRVAKQPWGVLFSATMALATFKVATLVSWQYAAAMLPALCALLLISLADRKYRIIPDQFVIVLAVTGIGFAAIGRKFAPFTSNEPDVAAVMARLGFLSPIFGLLMGGGAFLAVSLIGKIVTKQEVMGFGDVKLMAVCGLISGADGVLLIMVMTALSSAMTFVFLMSRGKLKRTDDEPLGPFIAGATAVYLIFSEELSWLSTYYFGG